MTMPAAIRAPILAIAIVAAFAAPAALPPQAAAQEAMVLETDASPIRVSTPQGEFAFTVEIADETDEQAKGLMHRQDMGTDHGMLFAFGRSKAVTMWMKNTPMSLDMVFIREDGTIAGIAERTTPFSEDIVASPEPVAYVLELKAGVARLVGLKAGDRLRHPIFAD